MSGNFSSSSNNSFLQPQFPVVNHCFLNPPSSFIFTLFFITNILLFLPFSVFILYLVLQRWRQQSSTSTAAMTSHSDIFTYHLLAMKIMGIFGIIFCFCDISTNNLNVSFYGYFLWSITWYGEILFNVLTCVELYLAVVHPITYLSLKGERGIRLRNIIIGCVWMLSIGGGCQVALEDPIIVMDFCLLVFSLLVTSFCSLSALCVLIRPGPGEQGGERKRVDQSKLRAFYTIVAILGVLLIRFIWNLILVFTYGSVDVGTCLMMACGTWLNLPSSLVLPLLFLHRVGNFVCCKTNTK